MPEISEAALLATALAIHRAACPLRDDPDHDCARDAAHEEMLIPRARAALDAAVPLLAADLLRPLLKRHPRIEGEWGPSCGACWIRGGGRAAWPCAEVLAISVLLPLPDDEHDIPEVPGER